MRQILNLRSGALVVSISLLVACGGDDDPCSKDGCADTGGTVFGYDSEEISFSEVEMRSALGTQLTEIHLSRHGEACTGGNSNGLILLLSLTCGEVGTHTVVDTAGLPEDCGVLANAAHDGSTVAKATAGSVSILEIDEDGVFKGNFTLTFEGGWLGVGEATEAPGGITGEFKASPCGG